LRPIVSVAVVVGVSVGVFVGLLAAVPARAALGECTGGATVLCLNSGRFAVRAAWRTAQGATGEAQGVALTADTGYFWFFSAANVEVVIKVLDGCAVNDRYWVFAGGLTDVETEIVVEDSVTGFTRRFTNPQGKAFQPIQDTAALPVCVPSAPPVSAALSADGSVLLTWPASQGPSAIREYRVRRGIVPIGRTTELAFVDAEVEPGTVADYYVRAVDVRGKLSPRRERTTVALPAGGDADFASPVTGTMSARVLGGAIVDADRDGERDLVGASSDGGTLLETALGPLVGGFGFTAVDQFGAVFRDGEDNLPALLTAELTGDAHPEVLGSARTFAWDSASARWAAVPGSVTHAFDTLAYLDLDDDEVPDVLTAPSGSPPALRQSPGLGDGNYSAATSPVAGLVGFAATHFGPSTAADFDRDGLADLVLWDNDRLRIAHQASPGEFVVVQGLPAVDSRYFRTALLVADVTGDGYPDLLYPDYTAAPPQLKLHANDGAGGFAPAAVGVAVGSGAPWNLAAGDLDGDDRPDLVIVTQDSALLVLLGQPDGSFALDSTRPVSGLPNLLLADVDRDGDLDLLTLGGEFGSGEVRLFLDD
jgi:hypothetical protein